ncbi:MAG: O-methyltransferase [Candidatus Binatus sp.]|jgi:hypothetical protein
MVQRQASFERIDYSIRTNKSIQRKLIIEFFEHLRAEYPIDTYQYIGLGSMWFTDFVLFHKRLQLREMISIERRKGYSRARFNRPYSCIRLKRGKTTGVLRTLDLMRPSIVWLDYDHELQKYIFRDLEFLIEKVPKNSVIIVTIEAEAAKFGNVEDRSDIMWEDIGEEVGTYMPESLDDELLSADEFPSFVAKVLGGAMQEIASRRMEGLRFAPVFNYLYKDGARMVTVGGMVVSHEELAVVRRVTDAYKEFYTADQPCRIAAPPLTPKEKATLDTLLPRSLYINEKKLGFALEKDQIEQYRKFYRQYPVFWELSP